MFARSGYVAAMGDAQKVSAAIIVSGGLVLLTRRARGEKLAGHWEFPGGKLEDGESLQRCVEREIHEELGVSCIAGGQIASSLYNYEGGAIELIAIHVEATSHDFTLSVHDAVAWVDPATAAKDYMLAPADIPLAQDVAVWLAAHQQQAE